MAAGFLETILPDLNTVQKKIEQAVRAKPGHLGSFAHLEIDSLQQFFHPALVLLTGRTFNGQGDRLTSLAYVVQLIHLASGIHFGIPEDLEDHPGSEDPRNGSQLPVLVGDYLYGKFFDGLCQGQILEFLSPLSEIISEMNYGALQRRKQAGLPVDGPGQAVGMIEREVACLPEGACRIAAALAGASEEVQAGAADFGFQIGIAYGILERDLDRSLTEPYFAKARQALDRLPAGAGRDNLGDLVDAMSRGDLVVPKRRIGRGVEMKQRRIGDMDIPAQYKNKEEYVHSVFSSIAKRYDLLNTVLSFNRDKYWRKFTVEQTGLAPGERVLDVCCGTGMITTELARRVGPGGEVTGLDFNKNMLEVARANLKESPHKNIKYVQGNAMDLPFADDSYDCVTIGFGLRNVPDLKKTLQELVRVVRPGGRVVCLEFSKPTVPVFKQIYHFYFDKWVPFLGTLGVGIAGPYRYLHNSWKVFPHQKDLAAEFIRQGMEQVRYDELTGGIVSVHVGVKPAAGALPADRAMRDAAAAFVPDVD